MDTITTYLIGGTIEGWHDCYEGCFAIEPRGRNLGDDDYSFDDFWADIIRDAPTGTVYFDGFLIAFGEVDGLALMKNLERDYAVTVECERA